MSLFYQVGSILALMGSILFIIESVEAGKKLDRVFNAFMSANFIVLFIVMITQIITSLI